MKHVMTKRTGSLLNIEPLEDRRVLAALFPAYVDGAFTLGDPIGSNPYGLENTFLLSSRPSASKTIYLDFDGHHSVNNQWGHDIVFPAFDRNGNPNSFSDSELLEIQQVFQNVAEDFAPFDVNVTTQEPDVSALIRSNSGDQFYGVRALQTQPTSGFGDGIGGVAYLNSFDNNRDDPVFTFNKGANNGGMTVSHEVGHALGLSHDGLGSQTYHPGTGSGGTGWGPIMGAPFGKALSQWSNGDYANATQTQDDLAIITKPANGFGFRPDDHGNSIIDGTFLPTGNSEVTWGIIETRTDIDTFTFVTNGGSVSISAAPFQLQPNLDIQMTLLDDSGAVITSNNPLAGTSASISTIVDSGRYHVQIDGVGRDGRYSDYGSLGFFTIQATYEEFSNDGDFNDDNLVDINDIDLLTSAIAVNLSNVEFDMNGDGQLNLLDRDEWLAVAGTQNLASGVPYLPGDANLDGVVDVSDLNAWLANNSQFDSRWSRGDFDANGLVDVSDFNVWNLHKFQTGSLPVSNAPANYLMSHQDPQIKPYGEGFAFPLGHNNDVDEKSHRVGLNSHDGGCCCGDCRAHQFVTDEAFAQPLQMESIDVASRTAGNSIETKGPVNEQLSLERTSAENQLTNPIAKDQREELALGKSRSFSRPVETTIDFRGLAERWS